MGAGELSSKSDEMLGANFYAQAHPIQKAGVSVKVAYQRSTAAHKTSHCRLFSLRALRPSCLGYAWRQSRLLHLSAAARGKSYWNPWEGKVIISVTSFPNNRVKLWRCMFTGQACQNFLMFLFNFFYSNKFFLHNLLGWI